MSKWVYFWAFCMGINFKPEGKSLVTFRRKLRVLAKELSEFHWKAFGYYKNLFLQGFPTRWSEKHIFLSGD